MVVPPGAQLLPPPESRKPKAVNESLSHGDGDRASTAVRSLVTALPVSYTPASVLLTLAAALMSMGPLRMVWLALVRAFNRVDWKALAFFSIAF
jgi:hypothetical protein